METTHANIENAAKQFKKALEQTGKKEVVIVYSYRGKSMDGRREVIYSNFIADNFIQVLGTCDLVKNDLLNPPENE